MPAREHPYYRAVFLLLLAPVGAVVTIGTLLLLGATPHLVFLPGHLAKSLLSTLGIKAPNAVGVVITVLAWWIVIAAIGLAWERLRRPNP